MRWLRKRRGMLVLVKWLGLVVCVLVLGGGAASIWAALGLKVPERYAAFVDNGGLVLARWDPGVPNAAPPQPWDLKVIATRHPAWITWWPRAWAGSPWRCVGVPLWCLALPAGVLTAAAWRFCPVVFPAGACAECGYDRRGQLRDVKCPECGTVPTPASK